MVLGWRTNIRSDAYLANSYIIELYARFPYFIFNFLKVPPPKYCHLDADTSMSMDALFS